MVGSEPTATFIDAKQSTYVDASTTHEIATTTLAAANTAVEFKFVFWLEGTDASCFDCCVGQKLNITVNFDVVAE